MTENSAELPSQTYRNSKSEVHLYGAHAASVPEGWSCRRHLHHMMLEINLVLEGQQTAEVGGKTLCQHADELLLIPPLKLHAFDADTPFAFFVMHLQIDDPHFLQRLAQSGITLLDLGHPLNRLLLPKVRSVQALLAADAGKIRLFRAVYEILDTLEAYLNDNYPLLPPMQQDPLPLKVAREIETLVAAPVQEQTAIPANWMATIAHRLGYSRRHCLRAFQDAFNMAPRDYLFVLRQQEAMQLLANGKDAVERIAYRIGYDNAQSFTRQFAKWTGMTPGAFRRRSRDELSYLTPLELR
ncbi:AraC family transcriptional regulator [Cohnella sp. GbtcB17]|uniref:helix-turn-helix transcriptional regulator n=1 Tax=Cohnella sp. GbtcB17 TaxID=2824762 RepID=UPI001C303E76|nr:AraC family transcriptional regulator [Cohnella sp. GbtcB17]